MKVLVKRILLIILLMPFVVACVTNDNKLQSYMYYQQGCRYNVISAFDENGQLLASMSPMLYPALDKIEE